MKRILTLFFLVFYIAFLLSGCTININLDNPFENTAGAVGGNSIFDRILSNGIFNKPMYESCAYIVVVNTSASMTYPDTSTFTSLTETCTAILNTSKFQDKIKEKYPGAEYTLTLKRVVNTEIFAVTATSKHPENLDDICDSAVSLLLEEVPYHVEGFAFRILGPASPAQLIETK